MNCDDELPDLDDPDDIAPDPLAAHDEAWYWMKARELARRPIRVDELRAYRIQARRIARFRG